MSELELPQIQVGRYVDLLRRRKWQLLPAAALGLLVGLLVAWMIPRYYEAVTVVRIAPRTDVTGTGREDPFLEEIRTARITVRDYGLVVRAVRDLEWAGVYETKEEDDEFRREIYRIIDHINIFDLHPGEPGRRAAFVGISYRDQDKFRAADMANKIRELYVDNFTEKIIGQERLQLSQLRTDVSRKQQAFNDALDEKKAFIKERGLDAQALKPEVRSVEETKAALAGKVKSEIASLDAEIERLREEIKIQKEKLRTLDQWQERNPLTDEKLQEVLEPYDTEIARLVALMAPWSQNNPLYKETRKLLEAVQAEKEERLQALKSSGMLRELNPLWKAASEKLQELEDGLKLEFAKKNARASYLEELEADLLTLPDSLAVLKRIEQRVGNAQKELEEKQAELDRKSAKVASLELNKREFIDTPTDATPPPEPTYPNKALVAILGAGIGLGVAIGLIFLLDIVQATFKSYDDVVRSLPVPTLGGISFLELEEDIRAARARRLRIFLTLTFAVALVGGVVALYFLDPMRLPGPVRELLDRIFLAVKR